eukprot:Unigene13852_Nuclearia_a/m.41866 Unigene13852_Nuclearia_a/g.41866  ORF Unigene13852_Nuclearia_a/g.41866 Unigene13852_Nuclearia_a/m.41866 type:complete len:195 (+) Unigene13852_Nuclearia_a:163-747(+)
MSLETTAQAALRVLEALFGFIAFCLAASLVTRQSEPWYAFVIYLGLSGVLLDAVFLWLQLYGPSRLPATAFNAGRVPAMEMVISFTWAIQWFTAGIGTVSALKTFDLDNARAVVAFAFIVMALRLLSSGLAMRRFGEAPSSAGSNYSQIQEPSTYVRGVESDAQRDAAAAAAEKRAQQAASRGVPARSYGTDAV